jgi:hypothetical protein
MRNDKEAQSALNISIFHFFHLSILLGGEVKNLTEIII